MRKGFLSCSPQEACTHVYDAVSAFVPDQSLSLREMMMQFAYIGSDKLQEIVNRGYDGDEDDDLIGVDVGALDFSEVHDRMLDMMSDYNSARAVHRVENPAPPTDVTPPVSDSTQPVTPPVATE